MQGHGSRKSLAAEASGPFGGFRVPSDLKGVIKTQSRVQRAVTEHLPRAGRWVRLSHLILMTARQVLSLFYKEHCAEQSPGLFEEHTQVTLQLALCHVAAELEGEGESRFLSLLCVPARYLCTCWS